ncbi:MULTISPECIES: hypothetical protein [unclassified Lactobacillus]|uniref:aggregation-promoting factor n=1 Tax=unclassified Lactobacillus TaxID=2620435 RepID=UPI0018DB9913|nr:MULTISPECIES: hypothetical protein [unclassified Lactobacillus]MBH9990251.1 hypothetical protein [Lactobacillus sp. M0392]MBI0024649.1 hypothetical protein [Lactobacillus sp. W8171]MBI0045303.1 hypothetical protein [Lactobacillus sp. M0393]
MKVKSILVKSAAVAALSASGVAVIGSVATSDVQAATVENDAAVVTVNYVDGNSIHVWNSYKHPKATGQILPSNSSWKVIKTAYDKKGHKWYDLGKNQWVKAKYVNKGYHPANESQNTAVTSSQTEDSTVANNTESTYATNINYTTASSDSEAGAKAWIASRESGGSYSAQNGQYIGKYQLSAAYLNGDYSAANQERVANNYVAGRYGSWAAAKQFWLANGWY